jgi:hypothetical protein
MITTTTGPSFNKKKYNDYQINIEIVSEKGNHHGDIS